jgi:hypothetical protein
VRSVLNEAEPCVSSAAALVPDIRKKALEELQVIPSGIVTI